MTNQQSSPSRRSVLSSVGTGLAVGLIGSGVAGGQQPNSEFVLVQGETCVPIQPVRGTEPVDQFYDFRLPDRYVSEENGAFAGDSGLYASMGTVDLQRAQTSIAFLYEGPERLSLVFVHGSADADDGGSVSFEFTGLPSDGAWLVKDDLYRDPNTGEPAETNYDRWHVDGTDHQVDWTWGSAGTDGGAFGGLGADFDVVLTPAFNEAAALYDEFYEGTVTDWEFLSGADGEERISLEMDDAVRLAAGSCDGVDAPASGNVETDHGDHEATSEHEDQEPTPEHEEDEPTPEHEEDEPTSTDSSTSSSGTNGSSASSTGQPGSSTSASGSAGSSTSTSGSHGSSTSTSGSSGSSASSSGSNGSSTSSSGSGGSSTSASGSNGSSASGSSG